MLLLQFVVSSLSQLHSFLLLKMLVARKFPKPLLHLSNKFCYKTSRVPYSINHVHLTPTSLQVQFTSTPTTHSYPYHFLQDNCTCASCYHQPSKSRLRTISDLNLESKVVTVQNHKSAIHCTWDNGHESVYTEKWLLDRNFSLENIQRRKEKFSGGGSGGSRANPVLVRGAINNEHFPNDQFDNVMGSEHAMLRMLEMLTSHGVFLLHSAPTTSGVLKLLVDSIGFIRITHYGTEFTVKSEPNAVNLAYTSARLNVHTDLPYYSSPPGIQALHCIKQFQQQGGESHLVDGFRVAHQMKLEYPHAYQVLCEVPLEFYDVGVDYISFFKVHRSPTFVTDPECKDKVVRVAYSNQVLSSYLPIPLEQIQGVYEALKKFNDLCYHDDNLIQFKLREGQILLFDNWRMLHGREGFDPSQGHRHLEGCYMDWDEVHSRINVIRSCKD